MKWQCFIFIFLLVLLSEATFGQTPVDVFVDENGGGWIRSTPISWTIGQDPGPGGLSNVLIYDAAAAGLADIGDNGFRNWTVGDLFIQRTAGSSRCNDLLRFNPDGKLVFYSEYVIHGQAMLADVGFPAIHWSNVLTIVDTGNWDGEYMPLLRGNPGYINGFPNPGELTYHIVDMNAVPEQPASLLVITGGIIPFVLACRRRKH